MENDSLCPDVVDLRERANLGDVNAQIEYADYLSSSEVEADRRLAAKYYELAAEQGHGYAELLIGDCYYFGDGTEQDYERAFYWFSLAAENGYIEAMYMLSSCYYNGFGVAKDIARGNFWLEAAADAGLEDAQVELAAKLSSGDGIERNAKRAYEYYEKAAKKGNEEAKKALAGDFLRFSPSRQASEREREKNELLLEINRVKRKRGLIIFALTIVILGTAFITFFDEIMALFETLRAVEDGDLL